MFFLPNLTFMYDWFADTGNDVIELFVLGAITILITALSLTVSSILRSSSFLAKWLFGTNRKVELKVS